MGNIRKTDSKKRILKAFIAILNTDGFNKMTVSKITSLAHINRGTFYLNYIDKFDLLEEIEQEIFTKIKTILLEKETIELAFQTKKFWQLSPIYKVMLPLLPHLLIAI
ncbi:TetR/AcrR family transcriptional regulator [Ligilactobacillus salivarius]|uniref:TetR/AcrR family transcriptional regulator n=1 Tax=Ligilactobacillus salivarius TaxID=1624 RepID=UPI003D76BC92